MEFFKLITNFKLLKIIFITLFLNQLIFNITSSANANIIKKDQQVTAEKLTETEYPNNNYLKENTKNRFYILGPNDIFDLKLNEISNNNLPNLGGQFKVDFDGYVNLPRLKRIKIEGLTIKELTKILNKEYSLYLKFVDVNITMIKYRPAKVYLDGEVRNPGLHVLIKDNNSLKANSFVDINPTPTGGTTLFDALRLAGGVSLKADLANVEITRINQLSDGGGRIKTIVNLFDTLDLKDPSQNINLRDGDTVFVPILKDIKSSGFSKLLKSNINPKYINVYISGRVKEPGIKNLFNSSTLVDAINISGGAKVIKGNVKFLRYNNDGTIDNRIFKYKNNAKRGTYKNPYLANGDIVFVGDSLLSLTSEVLSEVTDPLRGILSTYSFYKLLSE